MEILPAEQWRDEVLKNYDSAAQTLEELKSVPAKGGTSSALRSARIRRAEIQLAAAASKADAAMFLLSLMRSNSFGEITLNLPDLDINVTLTWKQTTDH